MAESIREHSRDEPERTTRRKPPPDVSTGRRASALVIVLLPLLTIITSFVLATVSSYSNDWAWRVAYNPTLDQAVAVGVEHRSPFVSCSVAARAANVTNPTDNTTTTTTVFDEVCYPVRSPGGQCAADPTTKADSVWWCQQLSLSSNLLWAGCALLGAALVLVLALTAATLPQVARAGAYHVLAAPWPGARRRGHHSPKHGRAGQHGFMAWATLLAVLLAALGGLTLFSGAIVAENSLVNLQWPQGDWYTSAFPDAVFPPNYYFGPWLIGKALGQCIAGAVLGALASFGLGMVWETPRVGYIEEDDSDSIMVVEA